MNLFIFPFFRTFAVALVHRPATAALLALACALPAQGQPAGNPETAERVRQGVLAAQDLLKDKKYPQALARLRELDALPGKTPYQAYIVERTRLGVAAQANDDPALILQSMAATLETGRAPPEEELKFSDYLARSHFARKEYAQTITWANRYFRNGGTESDIRRSLLLSYYMSDDCPRVMQETGRDIQADEAASRVPAEYQLRLQVSCLDKSGDKAGQEKATAKYNSYYPKGAAN